ncbi:MAG: LTA synthase family protein [Ruminococcaceae bacterium]|nr:LTA synthase family protein [Oscillospiraceae bacterium]
MKKIKKEKIQRPKLGVRVKTAFKNGVETTKSVISENKRSIMFFTVFYILLTGISLILTSSQNLLILEEPLAVLTIVPRCFTLFICTAPALIFSKRRTIFSVGSTVWMCWHLIAAGCRVSWVFLTITIGMLCVTVSWIADLKRPWYSKTRVYMLSVVRWFYSFVALSLLIEILHRMNPLSAISNYFLNPDIWGINLISLIAVGTFIFLIPKRKLTFLIYTAIWIILSYGSYIKSVKVSEPIVLLDVFQLGEGISAMFTFLNFFEIVFILALIVFLILGIRLLATREKNRKFRMLNLIGFICSIMFVPLLLAGISSLPYGKIKKSGENTRDAFFRTGYAYGFLCSSVPSEKPVDYSTNAVETILSNIDKNYVSREDVSVEKPTNVIVIQLESFVDSYFFKDMNYEYDPLPFLHSLQKEYTSGQVSVPVFGGQTVKSEFEFLTGLSIENLPTGYNPYVQHLKDHPVDSLAKYMKANDYTLTAIHNYQGEFFNRNKVYYYMGFDRYIPYETMSGIVKRPGSIWAGDAVLKDEVAAALDNSEGKDFVFTVSVQLHGNYKAIPKENYPMKMWINPDEKGEINEEFEGQIAYYTSQMIEFDKAIQSIVEYLEERGEPTYLLMYSDHLPTLCNNIVENDTERYTTNFFTWNNLGIEKDENVETMELHKLSTYLCKTLNFDGCEMNKFHTVYENSENYNVDFSYIEYYKVFEESEILYNNKDFEKEATNENSRTYYMVFTVIVIFVCLMIVIFSGKKRGMFIISSAVLLIAVTFLVTLFIPSTNRKKNNSEDGYKNENYVVSSITPLSISEIILSDELLIVKGDGFTQNTHINISGETYQLTFVDKQTCILTEFDESMDNTDLITLQIIGEREKTVFSESLPFDYNLIQFGIEKLPENVQNKLEELAQADATPTSSPKDNPTIAPSLSPLPVK